MVGARLEQAPTKKVILSSTPFGVDLSGAGLYICIVVYIARYTWLGPHC